MRNLWQYRTYDFYLIQSDHNPIINRWYIYVNPNKIVNDPYLAILHTQRPIFTIRYINKQFLLEETKYGKHFSCKVSKKQIYQIIEYILKETHPDKQIILKIANQPQYA